MVKQRLYFILLWTLPRVFTISNFTLWYLNYQKQPSCINMHFYLWILSDFTYSCKYLTWSFFLPVQTYWLFTYLNTYHFIINHSLFIFLFILQLRHYIDFVKFSIWVTYIIYDFYFRIVRDSKNLYFKMSWVW